MREQLIHILTEAAEIEHNLLCSYLYAAFSLKRGVEEGLSQAEADAVARWHKSVMSIALEEMTHLALVNNLLVAAGGAPHFDRPNLPVPPGYHPSGFTARLTPFDPDTLQHFLFLERPSGVPVEDGAKFVAPEKPRVPPRTRVTPSSQDYETIGGLYELVEREWKALAARRGAAFLDHAGVARQLGPQIVKLPGLNVIRSVDDGLEALRVIVEQGEGAVNECATCHFARFGAIEGEWRKLSAANPRFSPAHPAAHDPVMRAPVADEKRVWITAPKARERLDLANAVYSALLCTLCQMYEPSRQEVRAALASCGMTLMGVLSSLGEALARLAASAEHPGVNAGLTFTSPRNVGARADHHLVAERLKELSAIHSRLCGGADPLGGAAARLLAVPL